MKLALSLQGQLRGTRVPYYGLEAESNTKGWTTRFHAIFVVIRHIVNVECRCSVEIKARTDSVGCRANRSGVRDTGIGSRRCDVGVSNAAKYFNNIRKFRFGFQIDAKHIVNMAFDSDAGGRKTAFVCAKTSHAFNGEIFVEFIADQHTDNASWRWRIT